jgi:hypothetical protein
MELFFVRTTYYLANEILHGLVEKTISLPAAGPVLQVSALTLGYSEFPSVRISILRDSKTYSIFTR